MEPDFMGKEGFVWAVGVVEDRMDPLFLGRCKVRWLGWHTKDKGELKTDDLPWAFPLMPITSASQTGVGTSPTGPVEGSWIMGFFRDGEAANDPVMLGTLGGRPDKPGNPNEGFNDPRDYSPKFYQVDTVTGDIVKDIPKFTDVPQHPLSVKLNKKRGIEIVERSDKATLVEGQTDDEGKLERGTLVEETDSQDAQVPDYEFSYNYPLFRFLGEPTTPRLARGRADGSTKIDTILTSMGPSGLSVIKTVGTSIVQTKADLRMDPYPKAKGTRNASFQEPVSPYDAAYPYNHVHVSESGHVIEIDDTPTSERLHWWHRSGTYREIGPLGTMVDKSNRDYYSCVLKNTHETVGGYKYSSVKYGYELCVNTAGGQEDYWLRVKGPGDVHLESEQGNVEIYCKDGIAFITAQKIEFNAKEFIKFNTPLYLETDIASTLPSLHGGPMNPLENNTGTSIKRKGDSIENVGGAKILTASQITQSTMGAHGLSAQSSTVNITHGSEEIIQGMNVINKGSGAGKSIVVNNGIINLRSAATESTGGLLLQLNRLPSSSEKGAKVSSAGYFAITPKNPATARITMATPLGAITMKNKVGEISLGDSPAGEIKIKSVGAMGEITISNAAKGKIAIDGAGLITIKNEVASLKKIIDDFFTEYQMHKHPVVGPTAGGGILPGAEALPMLPGTFPKTVTSQINLNSLLA
jgi:hypothetical protein